MLDIWPENLQALNVFYRLRTQWNVAMNGVVGLRYESMEWAMAMEPVSPDERPQVTADIQVMEQETLRLWREKR